VVNNILLRASHCQEVKYTTGVQQVPRQTAGNKTTLIDSGVC